MNRAEIIARADGANASHGTHGPWEDYQLATVTRRCWRYGMNFADAGETVLARPDGDQVVIYSNRLLMDFRTSPDHIRYIDR